MDQKSNNPGQEPQQGQHSIPQQPIRFQQHPGYPQNMMYAKYVYISYFSFTILFYTFPAVVNNATLTLPQNSGIYTSQTNIMNMADIFSPAAPYGGDYEQPTMIPHMVNAYPHYVMYAQPRYQRTVTPQRQPPAQPREKKILSLVDVSTNAAITNVSTASSSHEPSKHYSRPPSPVDEVTTKEDVQKTEDINLALGRAVANRILNAGNNVASASLETKIDKVRKDIQDLLNKITPTNFADLSLEIINKLVWRDEGTLPTVAELIFTKIIEEPAFVGLYTDLCSSLHEAEHNMEKENFKRHFHGAIIKICKSNFENTAFSQHLESISKLQEQLKEEESKEVKDEKKIADLNEQLEKMNAKEKQRMIGTLKFMAHLFRIGLLNYKIIENCIVILIRTGEETGNDLMTEYAVDLMKYVGPFIAGQSKEDTTKLDSYVGYLANKFKEPLSYSVAMKIMVLMELRYKKWIQQQE